MLTLSAEIMVVLQPFMQVCSARIWDWAQVLLVGSILAPGKRTVTASAGVYVKQVHFFLLTLRV